MDFAPFCRWASRIGRWYGCAALAPCSHPPWPPLSLLRCHGAGRAGRGCNDLSATMVPPSRSPCGALRRPANGLGCAPCVRSAHPEAYLPLAGLARRQPPSPAPGCPALFVERNGKEVMRGHEGEEPPLSRLSTATTASLDEKTRGGNRPIRPRPRVCIADCTRSAFLVTSLYVVEINVRLQRYVELRRGAR